jgi:hypothetical protein
MPTIGLPRLAHRAILLVCLLASAGPASADKYFGGAGGAFVPYAGEIGWTVLLEMGGELRDEHFRLGGEVAFQTDSRDFDLAAYGAGAGSVEATIRVYQLNLVGRYVLRPGRFTPYVGIIGGFSIVELDDAALFAAVSNPAVLPSTSGAGVAGGVGGLIGIETPIASRDLNLFFEGRAGYEWQINDNLAPVIDDEDFNGFSAVMGIRARF